ALDAGRRRPRSANASGGEHVIATLNGATPRQAGRFRIAFSGDFFDAAGQSRYPGLGLSVLAAAPHMEVTRFREARREIGADQVADAQGIILLTPRVTRATLAQPQQLLGVQRFGVGFETVDIAACTAADVVASITPGAVDRSVAEATVCWMLALSHNLL